jgi:peptidoglycan/LPS O-acetylase OafA/YrhL
VNTPAGVGAAQRLDFLDGLRGWAALVVVFSHLWGQFARHVTPFYDTPAMRLLSCGHVAVVVFFVLSGAALSLQFVRALQPVPILTAIAARYVRLVLPITGTTLIVWVLLTAGLAGSDEAGRLGHSEIFLGARYGLQTTFTDALAFSLRDVLLHYRNWETFNWSLWTMPVEFMGSVMIYVLLAAFARLRRLGPAQRAMLAGGLGVALLLAGKPLAACFALGYVAAEWVVHPAFSPRAAWYAGLAALVACVASAAFVVAAGREDDASATVLASCLVLAAAFWAPLRRALGTPVSRWLGRVSFPLYLIHVPVIACMGFFFVALIHHGLDEVSATHVTVVVATFACLACARLLMPLERASIACSRAVARWRLFPVGKDAGPAHPGARPRAS